MKFIKSPIKYLNFSLYMSLPSRLCYKHDRAGWVILTEKTHLNDIVVTSHRPPELNDNGKLVTVNANLMLPLLFANKITNLSQTT